MKWYFASRTRHQETLLKVSEFLKKKGEVVTADWLTVGLFKPYEEHLPMVQEFADSVVASILESDVFVLIGDAEGTDMFIELGIALAQQETNGKYKIYGVGEHAKRSVMQLHPGIIHVQSLVEVFEKEGISLDGLNLSDINLI